MTSRFHSLLILLLVLPSSKLVQSQFRDWTLSWKEVNPSIEVRDDDSLVSENEAFNAYSENLALQEESSAELPKTHFVWCRYPPAKSSSTDRELTNFYQLQLEKWSRIQIQTTEPHKRTSSAVCQEVPDNPHTVCNFKTSNNNHYTGRTCSKGLDGYYSKTNLLQGYEFPSMLHRAHRNTHSGYILAWCWTGLTKALECVMRTDLGAPTAKNMTQECHHQWFNGFAHPPYQGHSSPSPRRQGTKDEDADWYSDGSEKVKTIVMPSLICLSFDMDDKQTTSNGY